MTGIGSFPPALVFLVGALLLPLLPRRIQPPAFLLFPALGFLLISGAQTGASVVFPFLDYGLLVYRVDRLSLAFGYVFTLIALLGGIYGFSLMSAAERAAALLYAGSALGVVFAGDLFTLFVFWEIMAVSSVYLIWARGTKTSYKAGMRYLFFHLLGGSVLLAGILWRFQETGSLLFGRLEDSPAGYLILLAFAINAAVPPLHAWLSDSYPEATIPGSVFLSAFTTKAAVYALARGFPGWEILMWAGALMAVYGVVFAVLENDIRRILAYHIISQVGYMVAGVGLGTETAINGSTAHAFAHILYKGLLFMGAGAVLYSTGRGRLTELGGLARALPLALLLYMVGALSISGVPLFSGFVSKSLVVYAAERSHEGAVVLLLHLASIGTFLSVGLKLPYFTWFGPQRSLEPAGSLGGMHLGMLFAAAINIAIGIYPALLYRVLPFPVDYRPYTPAHVLETLQLLVFTGLGFWLLLGKLAAEPTITLDVDWFYRRPARVAYRLAVLAVDQFFTSWEFLALRVTRVLARASSDPIGYFLVLPALLARRLSIEIIPGAYDPDRYRPPVGFIVLVLLMCLAGLLVWNLFGF